MGNGRNYLAMVGIIWGCSSLNLKGVPVVPRVIDSDYQGEIQVLLTCKRLHVFPEQTKISQLLLLPFWVPNALGKGGLAVQIPVHLWGRNPLSQWGLTLQTPFRKGHCCYTSPTTHLVKPTPFLGRTVALKGRKITTGPSTGKKNS